MRVRLGSVAYLDATHAGLGIGRDPDGHRVELLFAASELTDVQRDLDRGEPVYLDVEEWRILAIDGELQWPQSREVTADRARFLRVAVGR